MKPQPTNWKTLFAQNVLRNKFIVILCILLLISVNIWIFTQIKHVFYPVGVVLTAIALPVILAGIAYYLLNPFVDWLERNKIKRIYSILLLFLLIAVVLTLLVLKIIPTVREQIVSFVEDLPGYSSETQKLFEQWIGSDYFVQFQEFVGFNLPDFTQNLSTEIGSYVNNAFKGIGSILGAVTEFILAFVIVPFILFYLLKDGKKLPGYILDFVPPKFRPSNAKILREINHQISSFIRGQIIVSFCIGVLLYIGYVIIGLEYSLILAITAACTSIVPYLGPTIAITPAIIVAAVTSPVMLLKMIVVWTLVQLIEGKFISPQIMGKSLRIHPITIIFVIIISGKLFGVVGILLAVPGYAVLKVIIMNTYQWFKNTSNLYQPVPIEQNTIVQDEDHLN